MSLEHTANRRFGAIVRRLVTLLALAVTALFATSAFALPKVGDARPAVSLVDGWDRTMDLSKMERPLLLIYEDKDSANDNQKLKDELSRLEDSIHYRKSVAHVAVADVSGYDYWPAKGVVKDELKKWSARLKLVIYADFTGKARAKLAMDEGKSNVVLYSKQGKVLFARSGALSERDRADLVSRLRSEVQTVSRAR